MIRVEAILIGAIKINHKNVLSLNIFLNKIFDKSKFFKFFVIVYNVYAYKYTILNVPIQF